MHAGTMLPDSRTFSLSMFWRIVNIGGWGARNVQRLKVLWHLRFPFYADSIAVVERSVWPTQPID